MPPLFHAAGKFYGLLWSAARPWFRYKHTCQKTKVPLHLHALAQLLIALQGCRNHLTPPPPCFSWWGDHGSDIQALCADGNIFRDTAHHIQLDWTDHRQQATTVMFLCALTSPFSPNSPDLLLVEFPKHFPTISPQPGTSKWVLDQGRRKTWAETTNWGLQSGRLPGSWSVLLPTIQDCCGENAHFKKKRNQNNWK